MKSHHFFTALIFIVCIFSLNGRLEASKKHILSLADQSEMVAGKLKNVYVDPMGRITLGKSMKKTKLPEGTSAIWSLIRDEDKSIYVGTGNDGKVFHIRGNDVETILDTPQIAILSLALSPRNHLLAGTTPDGILYSVGGKGQSEVLFDSNNEYIWSIMPTQDKKVWIITGNSAHIYRLSATGEIEKEFALEAEHARCMTAYGEKIYVGTVDPAAVYCIDGDDIQLIYEAKEREISAMTISPDGTLWFSGVASPAIKGLEIKPGMALAPRKNDANSEQSTLYRLTDETGIESYWSTLAVPIFDIDYLDDNPVVCAGGEGYIIKMDEPGNATFLNSTENPVTTLLVDNQDIIFGTSLEPAVIQLEEKIALSGQIESDIIDATNHARWGHLKYYGELPQGAQIRFFTRTGNSAQPDDYWSEWQAVTDNQEDYRVVSPSARFIQWKAELQSNKMSQSPIITSIEISLSTANKPPRIKNLIVYPVTKGIIEDQPGRIGRIYRQQMPDGTRIEYVISPSVQNQLSKGTWFRLRGMRTVKWLATDPDNDSLVFKLEISDTSMSNWTTLVTEYSDPIYSFDSTAFSDGEYRLRLTVSDSNDNPEGYAQDTSAISKPFIIDNERPTLKNLLAYIDPETQKLHLKGIVTDKSTRISRIEYSFDAEKWKNFISKDGLLDSQSEAFDHTADSPPQPYPPMIFFRVIDNQENVATATTKLVIYPKEVNKK